VVSPLALLRDVQKKKKERKQKGKGKRVQATKQVYKGSEGFKK
jgi:hypothetical protein